MIIETYILDILLNTKKIPNKNDKNKKYLYGLVVLKLMFILIAMYLAWDCNLNTHILLRLLYTITAGLFSGIYIIFYSIYRVLLNNSCY